MKKNTQLVLMFASLQVPRMAVCCSNILRPILFFTSLLPLLVACNSHPTQKTYTIGFSQCLGNDNWRKTMFAEMERELSFHENVRFLYRDAEANTEKQITQIGELLQEGIDLLIVTPNEAKPLTPVIEKIYASGVPVVVVDRKIDSRNYTAFIGASNFEVGQNAGICAASILKGKGNIIEMTGLPAGASPPTDRHNGFMDIISAYPGIRLVQKFDNLKDIENALATIPDINLAYGQNDFMAMEIYNICKRLGILDRVKIVGIDGLPTKGDGLDMVDKRYIVATVLYPTGGQEAILTAVNILEQQPFKKDNQLSTTIIDSTNIRVTKLQNEKLAAQQNDIDRRQRRIEQQELISRNQNRIIFGISISLAISIFLGAVLFFYLRENKKINTRLAAQNAEIIAQRNQMIELSKQAKEATEARFNFFTNISHELRTPLTLILGPLENVLAHPKLPFPAKPELEMVKKNAMRLLRLVNQLMDFRKIEEAKMKIRASENNITDFVNEITNAFAEMATKKQINIQVSSADPNLLVWFDVNMLDKILFNILSNAFKYTHEKGTIQVGISTDNNMAKIAIQDSGIGMSPETLQHAFDLFYQGNEGTCKGTGLGLALSKELITLHHGSIAISSEKGKGARFELSLPLGKMHFEEAEMVTDINYELNYEDAKIFTNHATPAKQIPFEAASISPKEQSILIIEDNLEIRSFMKNHLGNNYEVIEAASGDSGLKLAFEIVPDIVISDVLLPGKDGMLITETLKHDLRTSHIPIIILTARGSMEQQIEGLKLNADAYLVKPFNIQYLEETIRGLLKNREVLKEHYTNELLFEGNRQSASKKIDRKFITEFAAVIENNIANEDFGVADIHLAMGISRVQLYRKVKAVLGYNINEYILNVRMQKARYLLLNEDLSIGEVSDKVGFSSQTYFTTVFKGKFGLTPKAFKEGRATE